MRCRLVTSMLCIASLFGAKSLAADIRVPADYPTVQQAVDAASPGDTVLIAPGTYTENVIVTKALTLVGEDRDTCILRPAVSAPNPCSGSSLCGGSASNIILVRAAGVTIHDLTLDGDNPALTSGIVRDGADLDARNGIITDYIAGNFTGLTVHHCTVRNIYLRGIYASYNAVGPLDFHHNAVQNVQGDGYSIGIFSYRATGTIAQNTAERCNDAISANWSRGLVFEYNTVTDCASGLHTDNSGSVAGDPADILRFNTVVNGPAGSYGMWVFAPYQPVEVTGNTVEDVDVGLCAAGSMAAVAPIFSGNTVDCAGRANSAGAYVTTSLFGWGSADISALFQGNHLAGATEGVFVEQEAGYAATVALTRNRIAGNGTGVNNSGGTVTAEDNWWGCNYGPGTAGAGCPSAPNGVTGLGAPLSWLTLGVATDPTTVPANGGTSAVTATLTDAPDGTPVSFSGTLGSCAPSGASLLAGEASSTYTAGAFQGAGAASATVDGQTVSASLTVANPLPDLTSLSRTWARIDAAVPFTLTLAGSFFMPTSSVLWDGGPLTTTYVSDTELTVQITATQRTLGTHAVEVFNPAPGGGTSASLPFEVRPIPATVYVDDGWAGTPADGDPDGAGPATHFGYDAFAVIQDGVNAVATGGTVVVYSGTYLAEVTVNRAMLVQGAGIDQTVLMGRKDAGGSNTLTVGSGVTVDGFTVTRDGNNTTDWASNIKSQGVLFSSGSSGSTLRYCKVTGNRNGIYINNAQGHTVRNCAVTFNRTGFQFANNVTGSQVLNNEITENWTLGILFNFDAPALLTTGVTIRDNLLSGNWYSDLECRWTNSAALLDVSRNSFGGAPYLRSAANATEPSYATQIPVAYGGTSTPPGTAVRVGGHTVDRLDYTPWLHSGADSDPGPGFQGDTSDLHVSAESAQIEALGRINEALALLPGGGGTVRIEAGTYDEVLSLQSLPALDLLGAGRDVVTLRPTATTSWAIPGYPQYNARRAAVRAYGCADLDLSGLTLDMEAVRGSNVIGLLAWDTNLSVDACAFRNNSLPDAQSVAEITSYVRAPGFAPGSRALVSFTGNAFTDTGRVGIVLHDWLHATIDGNTFHKDVHDFGYAVELGSTASGSITSNTVDGYDTPAGDGSASAGLYIENSFTGAIATPTPKPVTVTGNEIFGCQYGLWIGNEYDGFAGDVDIAVTLEGNTIRDNLSGGVFVSDEDREAGSSVTVTGGGNSVRDNGTFGYFLTTYYDGEIHLALEGETVTGQPYGLWAQDYNPNDPNPAPPYGSLYDVSLTLSDLSGATAYGMLNATAGTDTLVGTCNWWGTPTGPTHAANVGGLGSPASDGVAFSPWAGTNTFDCSPAYAIPTQLVFVQQPTDAAAEATISPAVTVRAQDASGYLGYNFGGTVSLALSGGTAGATLGGGSSAADHGLATFSSVTVDRDGLDYALDASAAGLAGAGSDLFDISAVSPSITAITEESTCGLGLRVTFTPGTGAVRHDLLVDGEVAVTGYASGDLYAPPDTATHSYAVRAVRTWEPTDLDSAPQDFADQDVYPPRVGDTLMAVKVDPDTLRFTWTAVAGADRYRIWRASVPEGPLGELVGTSFSTELEVSLSGEPEKAFYKVQALNGTCAGPIE